MYLTLTRAKLWFIESFPKNMDDQTHLIILEPGQALSSQHKPVLLGSALHDADVVDGQPAFANDLSEGQKVRNAAHIRQINHSKPALTARSL